MRLITYNYAQLGATDVFCSSQSVYFPASNVKHEFRSKEWRSNASGFFKIEGNTSLTFTDADSIIVEASISEGTYSGSELAEEIKQQMESSTDQTFNVYKSEQTGLWTISSDLPFMLHNSASSFLFTYCGFDDSDYSGASSYTGSRIAIHTEEFVVFDLRTTEEIDSIALLWTKGNLRLTPQAQVFIEANATNEWSAPAFSSQVTINEDYEIASLYLDTPESYRFWRVKIVDPSNPYLYVSLGVAILGEAEQMENPDNGFIWSIQDTSEVTANNYGNSWVDEYPQLSSLSINFNILEYDIAKELELIFKRAGNRKPVFLALEPTGNVFDKDNYFLYGKLPSSFGLNHIMYKYLSSSLVIAEVL